MKQSELIRLIKEEIQQQGVGRKYTDDTLEWHDDPNVKYDPNHNFNRPVKINGQVHWISRSVSISLYVYCRNRKGKWCVLANQRGANAQNAQGLWNVTAGYLDYGESAEEAAARETFEETGVKVPLNKIQFMGVNSNPKGNKQDVSIRFAAVLDGVIDQYATDLSGTEPGEVSEAKWIPLSKINKYDWAFGMGMKVIPQAESVIGDLYGRNGNSLNGKIIALKRELSHNPKAMALFNGILRDLTKNSRR